jgi:hypothetical protein
MVDMKTREMARMLGRRGGQARARRLSAAERTRIASLGGEARRRSLEAARRVADNLAYAAAVAELRGRRRVTRMKTFKGPLPGLYPGKP